MSQNTKTLISFKTDKTLRDETKAVAKDLGIPLSTAFNAFLKQFVRDRSITLSDNDTPNAFLASCIREARTEYAAGSTDGPFEDSESLLTALKS